MKLKLAALCLVLAPLAANAYTGEELVADCRAAETAYDHGRSLADPEIPGARCLAYIDGLIDGYALGDYLAGQVGLQLNALCLPEGSDRQFRLFRAVLAHLDRQPPGSGASSRTLVSGALSRAFACGQ